MDPAKLLRARVLVALSTVLFSLVGCGGREPVVTPKNHLSELTFEKGRVIAGLRESLTNERYAAAELKIQLQEKEAVLANLIQHEDTLRFLNEQVKRLTAEKADQETALGEARDSEKKVKETLEKLKDLATTSTDELVDLRLRAENATKDKVRLTTENHTISAQIAEATKELDDVKAELTRTRAVVRSFQEHKPGMAGSPQEAALKLRIGELERAVADANSAKEAAEKKYAEAAQSTASTPAVAGSPASMDSLKTAWAGLAGVLKERWSLALKGKVQWDGLTWTVVGTAAGFLFFFGLLLISWVRGHSLRRRIADLQAFGSAGEEDLERAIDTAGEVSTETPDQFTKAQGSSKTGEEQSAKPPSRRSTYIPRDDRDFSAIISASKVRKAPEPVEAEVQDGPMDPIAPAERPVPAERSVIERQKTERTLERVFAGDARPSAPSTEPRRVIGLNRGEGEPAAPKAAPRPAARPQARPPVAPRSLDSSDGDDEEMANTQIISTLKDLGDKAGKAGKVGKDKLVAKPIEKAREKVTEKAAEKTEPDGDKELLNELKAIINKKFDELMKK